MVGSDDEGTVAMCHDILSIGGRHGPSPSPPSLRGVGWLQLQGRRELHGHGLGVKIVGVRYFF